MTTPEPGTYMPLLPPVVPRHDRANCSTSSVSASVSIAMVEGRLLVPRPIMPMIQATRVASTMPPTAPNVIGRSLLAAIAEPYAPIPKKAACPILTTPVRPHVKSSPKAKIPYVRARVSNARGYGTSRNGAAPRPIHTAMAVIRCERFNRFMSSLYQLDQLRSRNLQPGYIFLLNQFRRDTFAY